MIGRVHDAIALSKNMLDLPRHPKYNLPDRHGSSSNLGRVRLVDTLVRIRAMERSGVALRRLICRRSNTPEDKIQRARLLGHANAELGHADEAGKQSGDAGNDARRRTGRAQQIGRRSGSQGPRGEEERRRNRPTLMADALKAHAPRIQSLERAISREVKGFQALVAGRSGRGQSRVRQTERHRRNSPRSLGANLLAARRKRRGREACPTGGDRRSRPGLSAGHARGRVWPPARSPRRKANSKNFARSPATPISISRFSSG